MNKSQLKTSLFILFTLVLLTGCFGKTEVIRDTRYVYKEVPDELTEPVEEVNLMGRENYMQLTLPEREAYLIGVIMNSSSSLKACNVRFEEIRELESRPTDGSQDNGGDETVDEDQ